MSGSSSDSGKGNTLQGERNNTNSGQLPRLRLEQRFEERRRKREMREGLKQNMINERRERRERLRERRGRLGGGFQAAIQQTSNFAFCDKYAPTLHQNSLERAPSGSWGVLSYGGAIYPRSKIVETEEAVLKAQAQNHVVVSDMSANSRLPPFNRLCRWLNLKGTPTVINVDASYNRRIARIGLVIRKGDGHFLKAFSFLDLDIQSNTEAEAQGIYLALRLVHEISSPSDKVTICTDSRSLVKSINDSHKYTPSLSSFHDRVNLCIDLFKSKPCILRIVYQQRESNLLADVLSKIHRSKVYEFVPNFLHLVHEFVPNFLHLVHEFVPNFLHLVHFEDKFGIYRIRG